MPRLQPFYRSATRSLGDGDYVRVRPASMFSYAPTRKVGIRARFGVPGGGPRGGLGDAAFTRWALGDVSFTFEPSVEQWRSLVEQYAGDLPVNFLLAWIKRESAGNPCSYTTMRESGVFQLMPPDNTTQGGTTEAALREACIGSTQQLARQLTPGEAAEQIRSGIQYVNYVRGVAQKKLLATGVDWPENTASFWQFVKLQHAYPGPTVGWLMNATAKLGRPPANWNEFRGAISGYSGVLDNAEWVGSFGEGGGRSSSWGTIALLGLLGVGAYAAYRWSSKAA